MGLLEEIQRMRVSGMQDDQIVMKLQEQGNPYRAISEAMSQSKIKQAIEEPVQEEPLPPVPGQVEEPQTNNPYQEQQLPQEYQEQMQQSFGQQQEFQQEAPSNQEYFSGYEPSTNTQDYSQGNYDYSQGNLSTDTIMEISEQVVSEKLSDVRKKLEKMSSFKTEIETKTESIEERLKRIEKVIDTLQTSVLRKVGDYVTNVEDIKHELIETQKTFAKVLGSKHHKDNKKH